MSAHIFAHSMWRTGSTALAHCFLQSDAYMVFYEPFHEYIGSEKAILHLRAKSAATARNLRHPRWEGGYFDNYLLKDPETGQTLSALFDRSASEQTVYADAPSDRTLAYLDACRRVAEHHGKRAFFGFCRSGTQMRGIPLRPGERAFYLVRDPQSQWRSYGWPANRYFVNKSYAQVAASPNISAALGQIETIRPRLCGRLLRRLPTLATNDRLINFACRNLSATDARLLLAATHATTLQAAREIGLEILSVTDIATGSNAGRDFGARFEVNTQTLQPLPGSQDQESNALSGSGTPGHCAGSHRN
ncbi:hypothetical protein [Pseudohoeflea coraliihabitans]|uniref:Sulfotransferase family protein n=1 Tax=Pseudohoeflea coraliihabitans TaxID=2860393 RepID=A0ABS6WRC3_9HYPH|nr:hypothetical protein [Pseudohoeflea sp. DP4N28-3]MBW3098193.1 hypothetical protein [Pseudohoeflea sp. DP4N28-3]